MHPSAAVDFRTADGLEGGTRWASLARCSSGYGEVRTRRRTLSRLASRHISRNGEDHAEDAVALEQAHDKWGEMRKKTYHAASRRRSGPDGRWDVPRDRVEAQAEERGRPGHQHKTDSDDRSGPLDEETDADGSGGEYDEQSGSVQELHRSVTDLARSYAPLPYGSL